MGPKKDIVGLFRAAALKRGMKFGVSEHLAVGYHTGSKPPTARTRKGVLYDGAVDKADWDLYHETHEVPKRTNGQDDPWNPTNVPEKWKMHYCNRITDLVDRYEPDLLYTDGPIFFEEHGLNL
jgi:alpha-L-fucosidase